MSIITFKQFIKEDLITFNNKAYPKFGQIVILAGGAGSGKGFIVSNLLGIEGKTLDVDYLKNLATESETIKKKALEFGFDLSKIDLQVPENVSMLHTVLSDKLGIVNKHKQALLKSVFQAKEEMKPNLIFDVTLKDIKKLHEIINYGKILKYNPQNIHLVWVINEFETAFEQNAKRSRVVPEDILKMTHVGASETMIDIVKRSDELRANFDGDIVFAFNKAKVDSIITASSAPQANFSFSITDPQKVKRNLNISKKEGGQYIESASYFYIKKAGKPIKSFEEIGIAILSKIAEYTPSKETWKDVLANINKPTK